jgi:hypothetical protein
MDSARPLADQTPHRRTELRLEEFVRSFPPRFTSGRAEVRADLDRHDIAVVLQAVYEWGGYRYTNASDALAAAKRGAK